MNDCLIKCGQYRIEQIVVVLLIRHGNIYPEKIADFCEDFFGFDRNRVRKIVLHQYREKGDPRQL